MRTARSTDAGETVQSVEKAAALLYELASVQGAERTGADLAAATKISKPAAYRILRSLERWDLVARDPSTGGFALGIGIREVAASASWRGPLRRAALPEMQRLRTLTGETIALYVQLNDLEIVCIETLISSRGIRYEEVVGARQSVALGATATVFLADKASAEGLPAVRAFLRGLDPSQLPKAGVEAVLERLPKAEHVYASTLGERIPGSAAIAAAIRRPGHRAIGALTISGPLSRFTRATIAEGKNHVLAAATRIARQL